MAARSHTPLRGITTLRNARQEDLVSLCTGEVEITVGDLNTRRIFGRRCGLRGAASAKPVNAIHDALARGLLDRRVTLTMLVSAAVAWPLGRCDGVQYSDQSNGNLIQECRRLFPDCGDLESGPTLLTRLVHAAGSELRE